MKILGISGGVDSCYLLHLFGDDNVMAVSFVNGWESETAMSNIRKMTDKIDVPHKIYSCDLYEFKLIQRAFLVASTPHGECPSDLAIKKTLLNAKDDFNAEVILTGSNVKEGKPPVDWSLVDGRYLEDIVKRFEGIKILTFPNMSFLDHLRYKRVTKTPLNDLVEYDPKLAKQILKREYGWQDYGTKHYENIYTKFNQLLRYYKFGIDMRELEIGHNYDLKKPPCPYDEFLELGNSVCAKLDIDFNEVLNTPPSDWRKYKSYRKMIFWR